MKKLKVYKSNRVIEAGYRLLLSEQRLILLAISQIDSQNKMPAFNEFEITVNDLMVNFDLTRKEASKELKIATDKLYERSIRIYEPNKDVIDTRWIDSKTKRINGTVKIAFANKIVPYLFQLKKEFTSYDIKAVSDFKSLYSMRFYEFLKQYENIGQRVIELIEIRDKFEVGHKYKQMKDFKKRVLDLSVKEINTYSDLVVSYKNIKKGRKIIAFDFLIGRKNKVITDFSAEGLNKWANAPENRVKTMGKTDQEIIAMMKET